jgi:hypothetical protein
MLNMFLSLSSTSLTQEEKNVFFFVLVLDDGLLKRSQRFEILKLMVLGLVCDGGVE